MPYPRSARLDGVAAFLSLAPLAALLAALLAQARDGGFAACVRALTAEIAKNDRAVCKGLKECRRG